MASECRLNIQNGEAENLTDVFDVANFEKPMLENTYPDFGFLRPIVWFSEYCLVDITTKNGIYRQAFLHGSPLAEALQLPLDQDPAAHRFSFCFTLPARTFESKKLDLSRLKQAISSWQESDYVRARAVRKSTITFNLFSCEQAEYNHYVKMYNIKSVCHEKYGSSTMTKARLLANA